MGNPHIIDARLHAPFFVFIRDWDVDSDQSVLSAFGLDGYSPSTAASDHESYIALSNQGGWLQISDDWYYSLWHSQAFLDAVRVIARSHEVFLFMIGDADLSFEIEHHKAGVLQRQFIFDQPPFGDGKVLSDIGTQFPMESEITLGQEPLPTLWSIVESIGIPTTIELDNLRIYSKPYNRDSVSECAWEKRVLFPENQPAEQVVADQRAARRE
jgi:hypothetical protein